MQESPRWRQRCGILWLPREARRRVVRLAFARPPAIHVGGRRPLRAVVAGSIHSAARLRDRGDAAAEQDPSQGPPAWRMSASLLADGFWTALAVLLTLLPFAIAWDPLSSAFFNAGVSPTRDAALSGIHAHVVAVFALALPWGLVALLVLPHATASFAATGKPADLFNLAAAVRAVRRDFATWNVAAAAIVTGWTIGLACAGLLSVGIVPGLFYSTSVSAHAAAALHRSV